MHKKVCIVQGRTLEEAKYFLKTKYGVFDTFIHHCHAFPIFGTGQGSGNSPAYWLFLSSTLFDMFGHWAQEAQYESPDETHAAPVRAIEFVDYV